MGRALSSWCSCLEVLMPIGFQLFLQLRPYKSGCFGVKKESCTDAPMKCSLVWKRDLEQYLRLRSDYFNFMHGAEMMASAYLYANMYCVFLCPRNVWSSCWSSSPTLCCCVFCDRLSEIAKYSRNFNNKALLPLFVADANEWAKANVCIIRKKSIFYTFCFLHSFFPLEFALSYDSHERECKRICMLTILGSFAAFINNVLMSLCWLGMRPVH